MYLRECRIQYAYETYAEAAGFELNTDKNVPLGSSILINKKNVHSQKIFRLQMEQLKY